MRRISRYVFSVVAMAGLFQPHFVQASEISSNEFVARLVEQARDICESDGEKLFELEEGAVTEIELNAEAPDSFIVDESRFACNGGRGLYCGSGGCALHLISGDQFMRFQALDYKILAWGNSSVLVVERDGGWCGASGADVCYEAVNWSNGRLLSIKFDE